MDVSDGGLQFGGSKCFAPRTSLPQLGTRKFIFIPGHWQPQLNRALTLPKFTHSCLPHCLYRTEPLTPAQSPFCCYSHYYCTRRVSEDGSVARPDSMYVSATCTLQRSAVGLRSTLPSRTSRPSSSIPDRAQGYCRSMSEISNLVPLVIISLRNRDDDTAPFAARWRNSIICSDTLSMDVSMKWRKRERKCE